MKEDLRIRVQELVREYESTKNLNHGTRDFFLRVAIDLLKEILESN